METKKANKKYLFWIILAFVAAFVLRLVLLPYGNHNDLITNTGWSEWIYLHGPRGFYENKVWIYDWPTQLPLINLIYDFNFVIFGKTLWVISTIRGFLAVHHILPEISKLWFNLETWFGWTYYSSTPFVNGHVLSMKVIPILSDMAIGVVVFLLGLKYADKRKAITTALLYLFIPFTLYISSLWGQYDQLSALCLLLSFYLVYLVKDGKRNLKGWFIPLSVIFYFVAVEVKPTAVFTAPFYVFYALKQKPKFWSLILSVFVGLGLFWITTTPFSTGSPFLYTLNTIIPKVFNQTRNVLSTQALNFWELISPMKLSSLKYSILGIKAINWGYIFLGLLNAVSIFKISKENNLKNMFLGLFVITGGSYMFVTGMLDRYYFAGLVFFLILTMFYKKTLVLWLGAAILFSINLFTSWGYPVNLQLHDVFWANYPVVRILSFLQVVIFIIMTAICFKPDEKISKDI